MQITRRYFLNALSAAAALYAVSPVFGQSNKHKAELFELPAEAYSDPLFSMTAKQFESFIGRTFTARDIDGVAVQFVLTEVNKLERSQNVLRGYYGECFSLIFTAPERVSIRQDPYEMRTDGLGIFSALIVPTGRHQREYEIIVNHITR